MSTEGQIKPLVLIVEDEPDNLEIMRAVVEDVLGYEAILSHDGVDLITTARERQPHVILMDIMLPEVDGFEAMSMLKESSTTNRIPVIVVTALGRPTDRQRALESGASDFVSKPFDLDELAAAIDRHLNSPQTG
jgi:putative two-component system response regulator